MLIKKNENQGIIESYYNSSNILKSEYNKMNSTLTIVFSYGGKYIYENVPFTDYTRFEMADSQGTILNSHIKPKYNFISSGKVNADDIKKEIKKINEQEVENFKAVVIAKANALSTNFNDATYNELKSSMKAYENKVGK